MAARVRRTPIVLLTVMTVLTLAGPFGIWVVIRGGRRPEWPPDRPIEWWVLFATCGLVAALMVACIGIALANLRELQGRKADLELQLDPDQAPPDVGEEPELRL